MLSLMTQSWTWAWKKPCIEKEGTSGVGVARFLCGQHGEMHTEALESSRKLRPHDHPLAM